MKININGVTREMTQSELEQWRQDTQGMPQPEPSPDDRMTQIEAALIELAAMLGGEA